ncbi:CdaR family protein [Helcococcus sueciensis]|uniref:CdaR family protein n=1 Tax=Helcococcus sueciensis TaxID=241555 RepID=UPI0003FF61CC|nr:CdaR family protein [Helcococcus sueciensis]
MEILKKNWKIKLLSLIIAIFMWSYIIASTNPSIPVKLSSVPIVFENTEDLSADNLMIDSNTQKTVDITLVGQRNRIINITNSHIRVTADFQGLKEGLNNVRLNYILPDGISIEDYQNSIDVNIEKIINREFPVEIQNVGNLPEDYMLESRQVIPNSITIRGPRSNIDRISKVVTDLDLSNLQENININKDVRAIDEKGETIDKLTYGQDFVNIVAVVNKQKEVTINKNIVGEIDDNYKIDSAELNKSTVLIKGPKEAIDKINSIETQDINIEKLTQSKTVPIKFILPSDISLVSNESDYSINLVVHKKINKTLEIPKNQIEVLNKPQNKNVVINSNTIKINLIGFQDDLDKIKTENIKLIVDLKNKESGTSHIRPSVKLDGINIKPELIQSLDNVSITLTE